MATFSAAATQLTKDLLVELQTSLQLEPESLVVAICVGIPSNSLDDPAIIAAARVLPKGAPSNEWYGHSLAVAISCICSAILQGGGSEEDAVLTVKKVANEWLMGQRQRFNYLIEQAEHGSLGPSEDDGE